MTAVGERVKATTGKVKRGRNAFDLGFFLKALEQNYFSNFVGSFPIMLGVYQSANVLPSLA